jgi:hypothetical protein
VCHQSALCADDGPGQKASKVHLAYLERDGVERDGAPGWLYGADDMFSADAFRAPLDDEPRQFRFGANPWRLQAWLGHSTITMTMRYVHHVEEHHRPIPDDILAAGNAVTDPDERVIAMLGARSVIVRSNRVATETHALSRT